MKIHKRVWGLIGVVFLTWLGFALATADSHHTNLRYLIWKRGWSPRSWLQNYHLFLVDDELQHSFVGKTPAELEPWFPDLVAPTRESPEQKDAMSWAPLRDGDFVWVGSFLEGFSLKNGRYVRVIRYDKG